MQEERLVRRCLNGEQAAYYDLVRYLQPVAIRIVNDRLPEGEDRYDAVQEILTRACLGLGQFRGKSLRAWVAAIARNYCCEYYRRKDTAVNYEDELPDLIDDTLLRTLDASWQLSALQHLVGENWDVLMTYIEDGPQAAAARWGVPYRTIKVKICRIRARLRNGGHHASETDTETGV